MLYFTYKYSAKSRIKGTLEIYHAFIRETREPSEPSSNNSDGEWEHVEATNAGEVSSQPVRRRLLKRTTKELQLISASPP